MHVDTKLWRLTHRGYEPQDFIRERKRLEQMHVGRKKPAAKPEPEEEDALSAEARGQAASADQRRNAPITLQRVAFLEHRLPGEPADLEKRWPL